jgi:hypothetical protein
VEYSASGTGKTVDLAGSSASLGAHLTIIVSVKEPEGDYDTTDARNEASMVLLQNKCKKVLKYTPILGKLRKLATKEFPLKIVFAIDEGSSCKNLVRSIIDNQHNSKKAIAAGLLFDTDTLGVRFMVGGTGAATGTIGSNTPNFIAVNPTGISHTADLCNLFLGDSVILTLPGETEAQQVTYQTIVDKLPALATLMTNGRMSSIAARMLRKWDRADPVVEANIVSTTVASYMQSNRMQELAGKHELRHLVAACAFAVHLFQWTKDNGDAAPSNNALYQDFMDSMTCGVTFIPRAISLVGLTHMNPIQRIVRHFGLLEPTLRPPRPGEKAYNLFVMRPAQQLVALTMLGIDTASMLEASPFGFEVLSTHVAKCAIAVSSAIDVSTRPDLQKILTKIGFTVDEHATSDAIITDWEELAFYKAADYKLDDSDNLASDTRQMKVELDLYKGEKGEDLLQIDKAAFQTLSKMEAVTLAEGDDGTRLAFAVPSTWIDYGASPLADGFVSFFCKDYRLPLKKPFRFFFWKEYRESLKKPFRFTLMIQAKDYHNDNQLNIKKLNEHAARCSDVSLDGVFGKNRLLCVAGNAGVIHAKKSCTVKRNFMPFASNSGKILSDLLETLESQSMLYNATSTS